MNDAIKSTYRSKAEQALINTSDIYFKRQDILNTKVN